MAAACASGCTGGKSGLTPASWLDQQASHSVVLVTHDPGLDRLAAYRLEQATLGHLPPGRALPDFENASGFDAYVGFGMVIAHLL
jgi:hypothetical protein